MKHYIQGNNAQKILSDFSIGTNEEQALTLFDFNSTMRVTSLDIKNSTTEEVIEKSCSFEDFEEASKIFSNITYELALSGIKLRKKVECH